MSDLQRTVCHGASTSPCIGVCTLDVRGRCGGCLRTRAEIAAWPSLSAAQQRALLGLLERRRSVQRRAAVGRA